jgi:hypothetical protein
MSDTKIPSEMKYHAFICHETTTAHNFALNLKASLKKMGYLAFVAPEDIIPGTEQEEEYRFDIIRKSNYFILILTPLGLESNGVQLETREALQIDNYIIPCINFNIDIKNYKKVFPEISKRQHITFRDEYDLANRVTTLIKDKDLINRRAKLEDQIPKEEIYGEKLFVNLEWSLKRITKERNIGHIIFKLKNLSDEKLIIYGYRMFRIKPNGSKDFYFYSRFCEAKDFKKWVSDPHINIILHKGDEHVFNWSDVNIIETYGINEPGKWQTEVLFAYMVEGKEDLFYSIGRTEIEYI